jgi:transposase
MDAIASHEKELSFGLRNMYKSKDIKSKKKSSHITKGKKEFDRLRLHIANSKENRYKNGAHIILETAIKNKADVIVMEWLDNYRPTLARDRRHNRRRMQWSVKAIQNFLQQQTSLRNMILYNNAPAYYTSKLCYRCDTFGIRCSLPKVKSWVRNYEHLYPNENIRYIREAGGYFFYCPTCKKLINADVNASFNLAKVYLGEWDGGKWETPKYDEKNNGWNYKGMFINRDDFYSNCDNELKNFKVPKQKDLEF